MLSCYCLHERMAPMLAYTLLLLKTLWVLCSTMSAASTSSAIPREEEMSAWRAARNRIDSLSANSPLQSCGLSIKGCIDAMHRHLDTLAALFRQEIGLLQEYNKKWENSAPPLFSSPPSGTAMSPWQLVSKTARLVEERTVHTSKIRTIAGELLADMSPEPTVTITPPTAVGNVPSGQPGSKFTTHVGAANQINDLSRSVPKETPAKKRNVEEDDSLGETFTATKEVVATAPVDVQTESFPLREISDQDSTEPLPGDRAHIGAPPSTAAVNLQADEKEGNQENMERVDWDNNTTGGEHKKVWKREQEEEEDEEDQRDTEETDFVVVDETDDNDESEHYLYATESPTKLRTTQEATGKEKEKKEGEKPAQIGKNQQEEKEHLHDESDNSGAAEVEDQFANKPDTSTTVGESCETSALAREIYMDKLEVLQNIMYLSKQVAEGSADTAVHLNDLNVLIISLLELYIEEAEVNGILPGGSLARIRRDFSVSSTSFGGIATDDAQGLYAASNPPSGTLPFSAKPQTYGDDTKYPTATRGASPPIELSQDVLSAVQKALQDQLGAIDVQVAAYMVDEQGKLVNSLEGKELTKEQNVANIMERLDAANERLEYLKVQGHSSEKAEKEVAELTDAILELWESGEYNGLIEVKSIVENSLVLDNETQFIDLHDGVFAQEEKEQK